jgi:hypothetical protein
MKHCITRLCAAAGASLAGLLLAAGVLASPASAYTVQSITPWMQNAAPAAWSANPDLVYYNSVGSNGLWNGYSASPDGSDPQCVTCTVPSFSGVGTATNRGVSDVSPDGKYALVTVERPIVDASAMWTQPGKGGANDVWLYTTDGQHAWPLTNIYQPGSVVLGSIEPRFDKTGNQIVWASMTGFGTGAAALNTWPLGTWEIQVANIVWTGGVPSLANIRTINPTPGSFYEPYGFTPDNQHVIFATSGGGSWKGDTIDTIGVDGTGLTQLSPSAAPGVPNYSEFAFYTPSGDAIIWGRGYDTGMAGMDYWIMGANGSNPQRLTYFNEPWSTEYLGYTDVGDVIFNPDNPNQFIMGAMSDIEAQNVNAQMVTLNPSTTAGEMTEQLYADNNFQQLVSTTTSDLSNGFKAPQSPAAGVPATNYSIRWSGMVTAPVAGSYSFCVAAEFQAQLYVNGTELASPTFDAGQRSCGSISLTAGQSVPVIVDYEHGTGSAEAQLSWIPPGSTTAAVIPSSDMVAATPSGPGSQAKSRSTPGQTSTTAGQTSTTAGQTSTTAGQTSTSAGQTSTTAGGGQGAPSSSGSTSTGAGTGTPGGSGTAGGTAKVVSPPKRGGSSSAGSGAKAATTSAKRRAHRRHAAARRTKAARRRAGSR